jgi:hypothetical protein
VEITLVVGKRSEEGITSSACFGAKVLPAPPDSVAVFMASFLFGVKGKAAVCSISENQDKSSLGSGAILNACGIWEVK